MAEGIIALLSTPEIKIAITLSKVFIQILKKSLSEDVNEVLKTKIADSELRTAQNVLKSLEFEAEHNWHSGIQRAITHLESAFDLYVDRKEFDSACICGLYLSCMHRAVGDTQEELYKRLWLRVPIVSRKDINFNTYGSYINMFFSNSAYQDLLAQRKEKRLKTIDHELELLSAQIKQMGIITSAWKAPSMTVPLRLSKELLEKEKRELLGTSDQRSKIDKVIDLIKPWWAD